MSDDYEFGYEIENILENSKKKKKRKKKNSGDKGDRGERLLCDIFNKRFNTNKFSRVMGSGNRWSQIEFVKKDYIGDIVSPDEFKFVIECKFGYSDDLDMYSAIINGHHLLDKWIDQANDYSERSKRHPLICWKREYLPWMTFIKADLLNKSFEYQLNYKNWIGISLKSLLTLSDEFFLDQ